MSRVHRRASRKGISTRTSTAARAFTGWTIEDGTGLGAGRKLPVTGKPTYVEHHRTLGDRVREIVAAGLVLEDLVEPEWPPELHREWGQWSPLRGRIFPGTAIFVADKPRLPT